MRSVAATRSALAWYCMKQSVAEQSADFVTRDLLEDILEYEEEYLDWLETQRNLIATTGIQNYLQSQM